MALVDQEQEGEGEGEEATVKTSSVEWSRANWILAGRLPPCAFGSDAKDGKTVCSEATCSGFVCCFFSFWESISEQPPGDELLFPLSFQRGWKRNEFSFHPEVFLFVFFNGGFKHNSLEMELYLSKEKEAEVKQR